MLKTLLQRETAEWSVGPPSLRATPNVVEYKSMCLIQYEIGDLFAYLHHEMTNAFNLLVNNTR